MWTFEPFANYPWQFALIAVVCYFFGAINFSVIFSRAVKKEDIRKNGSGNPGTTNMFRVYGLPLGALTFSCDALKGVLPCVLLNAVFSEVGYECGFAAYFAGLFVVLGHVFPVYYRFRGGKGFACTLGILFALQPIFALCMTAVILLVVFISDRMSIAAIVFVLCSIAWHWIFLFDQIGEACLFFTLTCFVVLFAHRHNVARLLKGKEMKTGVKSALRKKK